MAKLMPVGAADLSAQEQRGQRIYEQGESSLSKRPIIAVLRGNNEVPAAVLPCINCHAEDGRGNAEGGVEPSDIRWSNLTKPYGASHAYGRRTPPYSETDLKRAISMGIDSAGQPLQDIMPRYRLNLEQMDDLIAYLKKLEGQVDPGISNASIRVAAVILRQSQLTNNDDQSTTRFLSNYIEEINRNGGIYGRLLELQVHVFQPHAISKIDTWLQQVAPFAALLVAPEGVDRALSDMIEKHAIPTIATFPSYQLSQTDQRHLFYLYAGLAQQNDILVALANAQLTSSGRDAVVVFSRQEPWQSEAARVIASLTDHNWKVTGLGHDSGPVEPLQAHANLVFYLSPRALALDIGSQANIVAPGMIASMVIDSLGDDYPVYLALPASAATRSADAMGHFEYLRGDSGGLGNRAAQIDAYVAAIVITEVLRRAGRKIGRGQALTELEGLYDFYTGIIPNLSYGPNRRVGVSGAHIFRSDPISGRLNPVTN